ncbi:MAG TPA: GNAT family N-acetyltransferase [Candidatus Eisenbacteria bacterium]|nr:GNAT family N-acetyltransferase [Candidatus Eisenbacteria bacterium]
MSVLVPMSDSEYEECIAALIPAYAAEKVAAGHWAEAEALDLSRKMIAELLPQGLETPDHSFFTIRDEDGTTPVGVLWIVRKPQAGKPIAHIYDIEIWPEHQRKGHATRALNALEAMARDLGITGLALHVFGHNPGAQALYARQGFEIKGISMFKPLE